MDIGFDRTWLSFPCPRCSFERDVTFLQARLQETVFCPCCKASIALVDAAASVEGAKRDLDSSLAALERAFTRFNRTTRIRL